MKARLTKEQEKELYEKRLKTAKVLLNKTFDMFNKHKAKQDARKNKEGGQDINH